MKVKGRLTVAAVLFVVFFGLKIAVSGLLLQGISMTLPMSDVAHAGGEADASAAESAPPRLTEKEERLRKWEEDLKKREEQLVPLQEEIDRKMAELEEIQTNLTSMAKKLAEREEALKDAKVQHLVSLYKSMEPERAAAIMGKLEVPIVVSILGNMQGKAAGQILAAMPPELGADISRQLSEME